MGLEPRPCDGGLSMARRSTAMEHGAEFGVHCERRLRGSPALRTHAVSSRRMDIRGLIGP